MQLYKNIGRTTMPYSVDFQDVKDHFPYLEIYV